MKCLVLKVSYTVLGEMYDPEPRPEPLTLTPNGWPATTLSLSEQKKKWKMKGIYSTESLSLRVNTDGVKNKRSD